MNTEDLVRDSLQAGARAIPCPDPDVAALVAAGRSRRRRQVGVAGGLAAGAAVVLAIAAGAAMQQGDPTSISPAQPSTSRTSSPLPSAPSVPRLQGIDGDEEIPPGSYVAAVNGLTSTRQVVPVVTVPQGYYSFNAWAVYSPGPYTTLPEPPDVHGIQFWYIQEVYEDPCAVDKTAHDPGPTVEDLATALGARDFVTVEPIPITMAGYQGMYLESVVPQIDFATCGEGFYDSWITPDDDVRFHQGPGQVDRVWVLDVAGHRLVIDAWHMPGATEDQIDTLTAMVEGLVMTTADAR